MTDEERALLYGLEERIDILNRGLLRTIDAVNKNIAEINSIKERLNDTIEVVNAHTRILDEIQESMTAYKTPIDDGDDYIH